MFLTNGGVCNDCGEAGHNNKIVTNASFMTHVNRVIILLLESKHISYHTGFTAEEKKNGSEGDYGTKAARTRGKKEVVGRQRYDFMLCGPLPAAIFLHDYQKLTIHHLTQICFLKNHRSSSLRFFAAYSERGS
ncbi:hypothetical protein BDF20DRAFT_832162 [Mycotypha africana]|uniref:uncharacterized protein n=1 Tax=Mycotypha africana TaxID=64632 RepID=UPI00230174C0|nr:uncharacterized protein BDF20DRAFT_832162 [Mycotypha africana]KAI8992184.1 hypothetical protein BDF20DRAFT_832162 [Mycotypha africana]